MTALYAVQQDIREDCQKGEGNCFSASWQGRAIEYVNDLFYEIITPGIPHLIGAIACTILFPVLAPPLWAIGGTVILTKLVIKVIKSYNGDAVIILEQYVCYFTDKYRILLLIATLTAMAAGFVFWAAGVAIGILIGAYVGIASALRTAKTLQKVADKASPLITV